MQDARSISRRGLIAGTAAFGASVLVVGGAVSLGGKAFAEGGETASNNGAEVGGTQYGFMVDMGRCVDCEMCVAACRSQNHLSDETPNRRAVSSFLDSNGMNVYVSTSCMHCDDPNCLRVCPAGAISKSEAGIVHVDKDKCIGCKYCFQACPYGVPNYNSEAMDKCDCCLDAGVAPGDQPYCAQACIFNALKSGPVDELVAEAEQRGLAPVPVGEPCGPNCYLVRGVK